MSLEGSIIQQLMFGQNFRGTTIFEPAPALEPRREILESRNFRILDLLALSPQKNAYATRITGKYTYFRSSAFLYVDADLWHKLRGVLQGTGALEDLHLASNESWALDSSLYLFTKSMSKGGCAVKFAEAIAVSPKGSGPESAQIVWVDATHLAHFMLLDIMTRRAVYADRYRAIDIVGAIRMYLMHQPLVNLIENIMAKNPETPYRMHLAGHAIESLEGPEVVSSEKLHPKDWVELLLPYVGDDEYKNPAARHQLIMSDFSASAYSFKPRIYFLDASIPTLLMLMGFWYSQQASSYADPVLYFFRNPDSTFGSLKKDARLNLATRVLEYGLYHNMPQGGSSARWANFGNHVRGFYSFLDLVRARQLHAQFAPLPEIGAQREK